MIDPFLNAVGAALLVIGLVFAVLAAAGILRMPDPLMRLLAASKAPTLGLAAIYLAVAIKLGDLDGFVRAIAVIAFASLTVPAGAHALGLAAYKAKISLWPGTRFPQDKHSDLGR